MSFSKASELLPGSEKQATADSGRAKGIVLLIIAIILMLAPAVLFTIKSQGEGSQYAKEQKRCEESGGQYVQLARGGSMVCVAYPSPVLQP